MGLQSLYGHLSRIDVEKGETVAKGQTIGNSGATGLAGGDHLHFEIILSGLSVNPVEWWDPAWLKNNVGDKLSLSVAK
jgi:murein DD-endopeptidase MepM/ murein hydrolase activator NlpD